jgi:hypothetical protein
MSERHRGLCWAEKNEIDEKGRAMSSAANDLYNGCIHAQLQNTNYGQYFDTARKKLGEVYTQLKKEEYFDSLGLAAYDEGVKALADGRTLMFNALGRKEIGDVTYNDLLKKLKACEEACAAYATAWHDIRQFDRLNKKTAALKRAGGWHAFSKQSEHIADMRTLLGRWGAMGA